MYVIFTIKMQKVKETSILSLTFVYIVVKYGKSKLYPYNTSCLFNIRTNDFNFKLADLTYFQILTTC